MRFRSLARAVAPVLTLSLALAACGDDDDEEGTPTSTTEADAAEDNEELCALAEEIFEQEDLPQADQIERYIDLAPPELEDAVNTAGPPVIEANGDPVAFFQAVAVDEVERATFEINDWERENCGIEHEPTYPDEATTLDPEAQRVDVTASEYTFEFDTEIAAGPTSFVMTNPGGEAHFMGFSRINEGHTLEEALAHEGDPEADGLITNGPYDSYIAAPGGEDEEVVTFDLEAGDWAMLCFLPGPDGTPHAFSGMAVPFTVS